MPTRIDDNYGTVALAVDDLGAIVPLKVDPVTGYLLVTILSQVSADLDVATKIDENYEGVAMAVDDVTGLARPLKVCEDSNSLLITIP